MKYLIPIIFPLACTAGDVQLSWGGKPPFHLTAERVSIVNKACAITPIFDFKTLNNTERVNINYTACTQFKVCNESGCEYIPRSTFAKGKQVLCKPVDCR